MSIETLMPAHKGGLYIGHNHHWGVYQTAQEWADQLDRDAAEDRNAYDWISEEQKAKAIASDSIWTVQWYPNTPVGFCALAGADLEAVLAAARAAD